MSSAAVPNHTPHTIAIESIRIQTGMRNAYIDLKGMPVIHRVMQARTRVDEAGDTINEGAFVPQNIRAVFDLSEYYSILAAYDNASNENALRLRVNVKTDLHILAGDRILFSHKLYPALTEDKEWQVADVRAQMHTIVVSKYILLVPLRDV